TSVGIIDRIANAGQTVVVCRDINVDGRAAADLDRQLAGIEGVAGRGIGVVGAQRMVLGGRRDFDVVCVGRQACSGAAQKGGVGAGGGQCAEGAAASQGRYGASQGGKRALDAAIGGNFCLEAGFLVGEQRKWALLQLHQLGDDAIDVQAAT